MNNDQMLALPANPTELIRHLMEEHGWSVQGYHPSMVTSHRMAHGADVHPALRSPVGHNHPFTRAFGRRFRVAR